MKSLLSFFLLLIIFLIPSYAESTASHSGIQDFQQAQSAVQEGSLEEAEDHFKKALVLEPSNPEYHFELANLYALQHDDSEKIGDTLGADRKMRQAANELERAVMSKPEFLAAHFNLGVVYKKLGKYEEARKEFKEVLKLDSLQNPLRESPKNLWPPSQVPARMQIAATYEAQGFYDEAETLYQEIREQYPTSPEVRDALEGLSLRREKALHEGDRERGMRMNALSGGLSSLSRNGQAANSFYGANNSSGPQSAGIGQALPYLGQWALQQFMKRKDGNA